MKNKIQEHENTNGHFRFLKLTGKEFDNYSRHIQLSSDSFLGSLYFSQELKVVMESITKNMIELCMVDVGEQQEIMTIQSKI